MGTISQCTGYAKTILDRLRGHFRTTFAFISIGILTLRGGGVRAVTLTLTTSLDTSISQASPPSIVKLLSSKGMVSSL